MERIDTMVATDQITAAALDYVEGWFDGDTDRMRRALHPDLAKRRLRALDDGIATATCLCALYVDYLQLVRTADGWKIVNVLWAPRVAS